MTARVLVVDDLLANVKLIEARLSAEYFEVLTAFSGKEAIDMLARERVDVVVLDVMMPGIDGFETCRRIKAAPNLNHLPIIMVTALDQPSDRVHGLEAGADDFLTKPVDDIALITRVKNLARLKVLNDEMMMRVVSGRQMGVTAVEITLLADAGLNGRVLLVDDQPYSGQRFAEVLAKTYEVLIERDPQAALVQLAHHSFELLIVSLNLKKADGLRLCSQVRSLHRTRHLPIIVLIDPGDDVRLLRGLDMGVNDYLMRPIDRNEMLARVRTQMKRKRYTDHLRNRLEESAEQAVTDALTGLHNRRYMEAHLKMLADQARACGRPLSVLLTDIDYFKSVNDTYGHDAGDAVLREFAARCRRNTRGIDLPCRFGGEEFVIIMPDTDIVRAFQVGERLRTYIAAEPFQLNTNTRLRVTSSVGLATLEHENDTVEMLFKRADKALYAAKREGRNRVVTDAG
jgi:two-component system cell cycle response regulator